MAEQRSEPSRHADDEPKPVVTERVVTREVREPAPGPNASTTPPEDQYFLAADGKTKVNAYGEEIGSVEDRKRKAAEGVT